MTWKYTNLLNECIRILLTIALGSVLGSGKVFNADAFVPHAVKYVFYVALPLLVVRGLGIGVDFYDDNFLWNYIGVFLALRVIALVVAFGWVLLLSRDGRHGIGHVAVVWLCLTWISTVILGIPISTAVIGNPTRGSFYGLLAAISSFIFQLPFLLLFLECHTLEQDYFSSTTGLEHNDVETPINGPGEPCLKSPRVAGSNPIMSLDSPVEHQEAEHAENENPRPLFLWIKFARRRDVWAKILTKAVYNPVLIAIGISFAFSLSTVGPTYLSPTSSDYVEGLGWIWSTTGWFGDTVSPVSLFTMGVWMHDQGEKSFQISPRDAFLFMLCKLVLVPLLVFGLAKGFDLGNEAGRAAVLIAALPISLASFSLGSKYAIGESILAANLCLGTLLMLPTILVWNLVMDALDIFPVDS